MVLARVSQGYYDLDARAVAGLAFNGYGSAQAFHDPLYRREADAEALAWFLCGEKLVEYVW